MLRVDITTHTEPLDELIYFISDFEKMVGELVSETQEEIAPQILQELSFYPGPSRHGGRWSTDPEANTRARRYYWWAVKEGLINADPLTGEYIRSGEYGTSWYVDFSAEQGVFGIRIGSTDPDAIWVGGSLNQRSRGEAVRWQNPGHGDTGWPVQVDTVNFWAEAALELFGQKFDEQLAQFGKTGKTRRRSRR